jgi:hypothetical protein
MFGRGRVEKGRGRSGLTVTLLTASATFSLFLIAALAIVWGVYYGPGPGARQGDRTVVTLGDPLDRSVQGGGDLYRRGPQAARRRI